MFASAPVARAAWTMSATSATAARSGIDVSRSSVSAHARMALASTPWASASAPAVDAASACPVATGVICSKTAPSAATPVSER